MLSRYLADKVLQLLTEEKLSQRQVARLTGVSRATVAAIARGEWHARHRSRLSEEGETEPPPSRCPDCGALVTPPCLACHVRNLQSQGKILPLAGETNGPLQLELHPSHYARYLEVRAAAMARGEGEPSPDWQDDSAEDDPWAIDTLWPTEAFPLSTAEPSQESDRPTGPTIRLSCQRRAA